MISNAVLLIHTNERYAQRRGLLITSVFKGCTLHRFAGACADSNLNVLHRQAEHISRRRLSEAVERQGESTAGRAGRVILGNSVISVQRVIVRGGRLE